MLKYTETMWRRYGDFRRPNVGRVDFTIRSGVLHDSELSSTYFASRSLRAVACEVNGGAYSPGSVAAASDRTTMRSASRMR